MTYLSQQLLWKKTKVSILSWTSLTKVFKKFEKDRLLSNQRFVWNIFILIYILSLSILFIIMKIRAPTTDYNDLILAVAFRCCLKSRTWTRIDEQHDSYLVLYRESIASEILFSENQIKKNTKHCSESTLTTSFPLKKTIFNTPWVPAISTRRTVTSGVNAL